MWPSPKHSESSTFLNKKLVDHDKAARIQLEVKKHNDEKKVLLKMSEENPKRYKKEYKKWTRRDESVKKMQQNMTMQRLKPTCFTFIPLIAFFYVIRAIYTPDGGGIHAEDEHILTDSFMQRALLFTEFLLRL